MGNRKSEGSEPCDGKAYQPARQYGCSYTGVAAPRLRRHIRSQELPDRHDVRKDDVNLTRLGSVLNLAYNRDVENFDELVLDAMALGPER